MRQQFQTKRAILEEGLLSVGITPIASHGGFFLMGRLPIWDDLEPSVVPEPYDWRFCRKLATEYGVIGIPASPFFSSTSSNSNSDESTSLDFGPMARFAFCKQDETLVGAANQLKAMAERKKRPLTAESWLKK